ncbi:MAG TPA: DUF167 domain-containing protein [Candidatus Limnocylindria bacterium]|nr:DUF167 domain-containing protein [Candidatus Limnocylindria bacterium]
MPCRPPRAWTSRRSSRSSSSKASRRCYSACCPLRSDARRRGRVRGDRLHFSVRLTPRASRAALAGVRDGTFAKVTGTPVAGATHAELLKLLGSRLRIALSAIRIESGATAHQKRPSIPSDAAERLRAL